MFVEVFIFRMSPDYISITYATLVAAGGTIGYVKSGSVPSLAAGLVFGTLLGYGAFQTSRDPNNYYLTLCTSGILTGLMGARFYSSGKFMPAGLITTMSLIMVCRFAARGLGIMPVKDATRSQ